MKLSDAELEIVANILSKYTEADMVLDEETDVVLKLYNAKEVIVDEDKYRDMKEEG